MRWMPLAVVILAGCKPLRDVADLKDLLPEVRFEDLKVDAIDFDKIDARFVLEVQNPYPAELNLVETDWQLGLAGSPFLDGANERPLVIKASDTSRVRLPFTLRWEDVFGVVRGMKDEDYVPYTLDADLTFQSPVGRVRVPLHREGEMPALHAPKVSLEALRVEGMDLARGTATIELDLGLKSNQGSALSFAGFDYGLKIAGNDVAAGRARIGELDGEQTVTLPIDLRLVGLGEAAVDALTRNRPVKVRLTGDASVETPFGTVPFEFDESADLTPR